MQNNALVTFKRHFRWASIKLDGSLSLHTLRKCCITNWANCISNPEVLILCWCLHKLHNVNTHLAKNFTYHAKDNNFSTTFTLIRFKVESHIFKIQSRSLNEENFISCFYISKRAGNDFSTSSAKITPLEDSWMDWESPIGGKIVLAKMGGGTSKTSGANNVHSLWAQVA